MTHLSTTSQLRLAQALIEKQRRKNRATTPDSAAADDVADGSLDLLSWTSLHRAWLREGQLFDLASHLYLVDIYNCRAREVVIAKASQMGASEYAVSYALHACDQRRATVLYVFPTETHVTDFSAERINPALEVSPYLSKLVVGSRGDAAGRRGSDRVTLKRVRDRFLYLRGAQVSPSGNAPQLKSVAADVVIFDELDEMDMRAPVIGVKRLGHSSIGGRLDISTLTYHGRGIHGRFLESDQRVWHVPCGACGEWQPLTIEQVVIEWDDLRRPVAWHGMGDGGAFVACRKCGRVLDRLARGQWVTTYADREIAGFHLSKLFSASADLMGIIKQLRKTDETVRRECFNQDLGLPYKPRGGQISEAALDACRREYAHGPVRGERPVMGVDVGNMLHVVVRGPLDANGERPQRYAGELATFDELGRLIRQFRPRRVVIDGMPETRMARQLQADFPKGLIWLAYYAERSKDEEAVHFDREKGTVAVDRTRTLDALMEGFSEVMQENTLPANARDIGGGDYYRHLTEPVRVIDEGRRAGVAVARYVAERADHYCHAENYCLVAAQGAKLTSLGVAVGRGARGW